jgi:hypothetical protein
MFGPVLSDGVFPVNYLAAPSVIGSTDCGRMSGSKTRPPNFEAVFRYQNWPSKRLNDALFVSLDC